MAAIRNKSVGPEGLPAPIARSCANGLEPEGHPRRT
ncbi:hypothetical protein [Lysobacter enzymogenes]